MGILALAIVCTILLMFLITLSEKVEYGIKKWRHAWSRNPRIKYKWRREEWARRKVSGFTVEQDGGEHYLCCGNGWHDCYFNGSQYSGPRRWEKLRSEICPHWGWDFGVRFFNAQRVAKKYGLVFGYDLYDDFEE